MPSEAVSRHSRLVRFHPFETRFCQSDADMESERLPISTMAAGEISMRNVFDQYSQTENKLTHALACCLHEDVDLLRDFAGWLSPHSVPEGPYGIH